MAVTVHLEAEINPTESEEKVKTAVTNVLGNPVRNPVITTKPEGKISLLTAEAQGQDALIKLRNLLRNDRIRDAARKALLRSIKGSTISFCLNKQVAYAGHISFSEQTAESPQDPSK